MTKKPVSDPESEESRHPEPKRFQSASVWLGGDSVLTVVSIISWIEIFAIALIVSLLCPAHHAKARTPVRDAVGWDILRIDGNRAKEAVLFSHTGHKERLEEGKEGCRVCHHMSKPNDGPTSCYVCHRDMYQSVSIFDHRSHQEALGGNRSCGECHEEDKAKEHVKACKICHPEYRLHTGGFIARSYESAMHSLCVGCHRREDQEADQRVLAECSFCHPEMHAEE